MKRLYFILSLFFVANSFSQRVFRIKNFDTQEDIPFSRADVNDKPTARGNIDGYLTLPKDAIGKLKVSAFEFYDTTFLMSEYKDSVILLRSKVRIIEEAIIVPGENPAHRIINLVIDNKKKNDPLRNDAFTYNAYNRFIASPNLEKLNAISDTAKSPKLIERIKKSKSKHLFLTETYTERRFLPPFRDKELITDYRASGVSDPLMALLSSQMQSFSFYENQFTILEKNYLNPIAAGGTRRYLFVIVDTTFQNKDTTYGISFRPRKGTSFDGLKGMLYVNSNGYAVEKVIATPNDTTTVFDIKITQEYSNVNGFKWFPLKLISELELDYKLDGLVKTSLKSVSEIKNLKFNPENLTVKNDNYVIDFDPNASFTTKEAWDAKRGTKLSKEDEATYLHLDSVGKSKNWDRKFKTIEAFRTGKLPLFKGKFALDINSFLRYNAYEKVRFGLGLETGPLLMKRIIVGGYFGYGTRDKAWKYGGFTKFNLNPSTQGNLKLSYKEDIAERGLTNFESEGYKFGASNFYRKLYARYFDKEKSAQISYSFYPRANVFINTIGQFQRVTNTQGYEYIGQTVASNVFETAQNRSFKSYDNFTAGVELKWNIKEKALRLIDKRYALPTLWPLIRVQILKALPSVFGSEFNFWRFAAEIEETVNIRAVGRLRMLATAGSTLGNAPLLYQHTALGTGGKFSVSVPNTFETSQPGEFYSDQQVCFFTRLTFKSFETNSSWFRPQINLHHALGFGSMREKERNLNIEPFKTMEKGLFEGGIIVDGLIATKFTSLGFGIIHRYGKYSQLDELKNITYKIALKFSLE